MNGDFFSIREGIGHYMGRFYSGLVADTKDLQEYVSRGLERSVFIVPDRMVDAVEEMLASYQKNRNNVTAPPSEAGPYKPGENALFPVIFVALAKDIDGADAAFGQRMVDRCMVQIDDAPDASVYGYRQAMGGQRVQIAILAAESNTAKSIAAQFAHFVGVIPNRRFKAPFRWGQYTLQMPVMLESSDLVFSPVATENKTMTILVTDIQLKVTIPYLDAPKAGEDNDGSSNNPPGYPVVQRIDFTNHSIPISHFVEVDP